MALSPSNRYTLRDIVRMKVRYVPFSEKYRAFIGNIPLGSTFSALMTGGPASGKSTFSLGLANEFARFGPVLYFAAEEKVKSGGIRQRAMEQGIDSDKIVLYESQEIAELTNELDTGEYSYCIIDSISCIRNGDEEVKPQDVVRLKARYPNVTFVFIVQTDKTRRTYKGAAGIAHDVDIEWFSIGKDDQPRYMLNRKNRNFPTATEFFIFEPAKRESRQKAEERKMGQGQIKKTWQELYTERRIMERESRKGRTAA